MNRLTAIFLSIILMVGLAPLPVMSQANLRQPTVYAGTLLNVKWTAGTLNLGGHAVTVTAGNANTTASKTDCSGPAYSSCNFLYVNSSGTVANSTTLATAMATGNSLLAYIETGMTAITRIAFANQSNDNFVDGTLTTNCGTSASCATPAQVYGKAVRVAMGTTALSSGTPSAVTITGISPAFTGTTTYHCTATPIGNTKTIADKGVAITLVSGSSFTLTGDDMVTTTISWQCIGY